VIETFNILKSTINNLIQENKQLLESNKQLKMEDSKLRDFIKVAASKLETQIQLILGGLNCCREHYESLMMKAKAEVRTTVEELS
jgi:hypothetical protein